MMDTVTGSDGFPDRFTELRSSPNAKEINRLPNYMTGMMGICVVKPIRVRARTRTSFRNDRLSGHIRHGFRA
jgi:hypothetical protein